MINVGTVGAYLTLSTTQFHKGIGEALTELDRLENRTKTASAVFDILKSALSSAVLSINPLISAYNAASNASALFSSRSGNAVYSAAEAISGAAQNISGRLSSIGTAFTAAKKTAGTESRELASSVIAPFSALKNSAYTSMANVGDGFVSGLDSKRSSIISKAKSIANSVASTIRSALRIASPSKVTRSLGRDTGLGFELGLEDARSGIEERARMLAVGTGLSLETSAPMQTAYPSAAAAAQQTVSSARTEQQLDRLIRAVEQTDTVLQVDGRTFARLVREYNR